LLFSAEWNELLRTKIFKGGILSGTHRENRLQIVHHQEEQVRMQFRYIEKLPATFCLALLLLSGVAHADDNSLVREANAALSHKDYNGAFSKFAVLAQHGNTSAQFNLGAFYLNGQGVQRDEKQAYEWFAKSAAQGDARALRVLQNAAAKGNENAKNELNIIQQQTEFRQTQPHGLSQQASPVSVKGKSLLEEANTALAQKDYNAAFPKFLTLAQQGNASAQFNVGAFYLNGQGVQKDQKQAYDWFAKSAAQGDARASQVMQDAAAKAESEAQAKAKAQAKAQAKPKTTTTASHARSRKSGDSSSSDFSLGVSLGQTGKLEGVNNSSSLGLLAGYKFNSSFGVELAYNSLYRNAKADSLVPPGSTGTYNLTSVSVAGQYTYGLSSNISLLGNLGYHKSSCKLNSSDNSSWTGSSKGMVVGLKVQYDLSKSIGVRGGFDTYAESGGITGTLTEFGMAVITRF
jgi:uncharacterized protein